ncbi:UPF0361 protein C3orf37-like protein isoform 1 [Hibiscus syriacus]|uniref:UPF0361 protein C3orf37-like protein isoform 1 n=1 Tax=Hibiscus syriacus TaxID=106335 RepID=A0A6A2ZVL6_HIBSY|nr:uncharacterized protein LOC120139035 [Hibiscus syriacus]KAE8695299.1 UPF0361 protein C3orf37-like protein isoform 1 [Hibiscus syriacus]
MLSSKRLHTLTQCLRSATHQLRFARNDAASSKRRPRTSGSGFPLTKTEDKSEWWVVDGEMHEIGDHVPPRERFVVPRDNIPNKRRKQLREQFMRRTRLVIKESEHEPWCKKYMELYSELRENWERLYWDEGYSKKIAKDHAKYESAEEDDQDFNPYRSRGPRADLMKDQGFVRNRQADNLGKVNQLRDKFEFDREKRMREKAFAPINEQNATNSYNSNSGNQPFDTQRYFSDSD